MKSIVKYRPTAITNRFKNTEIRTTQKFIFLVASSQLIVALIHEVIQGARILLYPYCAFPSDTPCPHM